MTRRLTKPVSKSNGKSEFGPLEFKVACFGA